VRSRIAQSRAAQSLKPSDVATWHRIFRVGIVINRKHRHKNVKMRGVFDVAAGGVLSGLRNRLSNGCLHFVRIGLSRNSIKIEVQCWLINAVQVSQEVNP